MCSQLNVYLISEVSAYNNNKKTGWLEWIKDMILLHMYNKLRKKDLFQNFRQKGQVWNWSVIA